MKIVKKMFTAVVFIVLTVTPVLSLDRVLSAEEIDAKLEEEFKWLRAEAEVTLSIATRTEMTEETAPSIVSVITGEQIRNMGARTIVDVLRTVPGFDLTRFAALPLSRIYIRGMSSSNANEKIRIMLNGHPLKDFYWEVFGPHFDALPLANIKKIEIIRGPGSALYGTDAFLGVINIITEQGGDKASELSVEVGSDHTVKPYSSLSYKKDEFKACLYADYYRTDGYEGTIESDYATKTFGPEYSAAPGKINNNNSHCAVQTDIRYKDFYFSGFLSKMNAAYSVGPAFALSDENDMKTWYGYGETGYSRPIGDSGHLKIKAYHDYAEVETLGEMFSEETVQLPIYTGFPENEGVFEGAESRHAVTGGELTVDSKIFPGIELTGGISYDYVRYYDMKTSANYNNTGHDVEIGGVWYKPFQYLAGGIIDLTEIRKGIGEKDRNISAAYAQSIFDLKQLFSLNRGAENLSLTLGGRYDHYDDIGSSTTPRLGIVYAPTKKLWFKILYGEAFRASDFSELSYQIKDLKPEKIATTECFVGYHFSPNISAGITLFQARASDLIVWQLVEDWQVAEQSAVLMNLGEIQSEGAEAEVKVSFGRYRYAYLNFTWQNAEDTTHAKIMGTTEHQKDFNLGGIPEFYGNIGMNYDFFNEHVIAAFSVNYTGKRERSGERIWDGEKLVHADQRDAVKARTLVNASLTFRNFFKATEIQISAFNLFNADNRSPIVFKAGLENDMPGPGRSFTGRISYSF